MTNHELKLRDVEILQYLEKNKVVRKSILKKKFFPGKTDRAFNKRIKIIREFFPELIEPIRVPNCLETLFKTKFKEGVESDFLHRSLIISDLENIFTSTNHFTDSSGIEKYQVYKAPSKLPKIQLKETGETLFYTIKPNIICFSDKRFVQVNFQNKIKTRRELSSEVRRFENSKYTNVPITLLFCASKHIARGYEGALYRYSEKEKMSLDETRLRIFNLNCCLDWNLPDDKYVEIQRHFIKHCWS